MKKLTQFLVAAAMVVGGSAFAQTATQTVTTNVAGALSIALAGAATGDAGATTITTSMTTASAGNASTGDVYLKIKSSDSTGFNVTAATDNAGGKMCEWDTASSAYTANCLTNPLQLTSSSVAGFTGNPTVVSTATNLTDATPLQVVSSSEQVTDATVKATVSQTMDWQDKVITSSNLYQVKVTYTINSGI